MHHRLRTQKTRTQHFSSTRGGVQILPLFIIVVFLSLGFMHIAKSYARISEIQPRTETTLENIKPSSTISIVFPESVRAEEFTQHIRLEPPTNYALQWEDENKKLRIQPRLAWETGTQYTLSLPKGQTNWFGTVAPTQFSFTTWSPPEIISVTPTDGASNIFLGAEDPVIVTLNHPAKEAFFDFSFNGEEAMIHKISDTRSEFRVLPKEIKPDTKYTLDVRVRHRDSTNQAYRSVYTGTFTTMPPPPKELAKDFPTRLSQAKLYTRPSILTGKYIDINIKDQVMVIFENGIAIDAHMISSGKRGMDTPKGNFTIHNKALRPWSKAYELYMPHWMAIVSDGKFGIHELPEWPGGYKEGANHLGTPVSHGCVRLGVGSAQSVYNWTEVGTPVKIY